MANSKKYVSLNRLSDFLDNLKNMFLRKDEYIVDDSLSSNSSNPVKNSVICTEFNNYYTEAEIDDKLSKINESISDIVDGTTVVAKATSAVNANNAKDAENAIKAAQDANGNIIADTYETKANVFSKIEKVEEDIEIVKNALLGGATDNYDTLKKLGDLIDDNAANINNLSNTLTSDYYTKTNIDSMEFITVDDIDTICESSIITVYSGTKVNMTNELGSDGDIYLVTE